MNVLLALPGLQAAARDAPVDREIPWVSVVILVLTLAALIVAYLTFEWRDLRWMIIRNTPFGVAYELKRLAERERRSPAQQALVLIEEALETRRRQEPAGAGRHARVLAS